MARLSRSPQPASALIAIVSIVVLDQLTKLWAISSLQGNTPRWYLGETVALNYAENHGAFLSLGGSLPESLRFGLFVVFNGAFLLCLTAMFRRMTRVHPASWIPLAAMLGGGLGNLIDRVCRDGAVIDFMYLGIGPLHTGIFNVADIALTGGALFAAVIWLKPSSDSVVGCHQPAAHHSTQDCL